MFSHAAEMGHSDIVDELIKYGAITGEKDNDDKSPIWHAAGHYIIGGRRKMVAKLLRLAPLPSPTYSRNVLKCFVAAVMGESDEVDDFIDSGILVDTRTSDGRTMLFYATECGNEDVVEVLLTSGASVKLRTNDPNRPSRSGDTPLTLAGQFGHMKIFQTFLDAGTTVNACGDDGETPLISLARHDYFKSVLQLIALGGSVRFKDVADDEYLLIPGTLETMRVMCRAAYEFEIMCSRVVDRLEVVCSELQQQPTLKLKQSGTLVSFASICFRFCRLLLAIKKREVPLRRLTASRAIARKVEAIHDELDHFSDMLGMAIQLVELSWKAVWEVDQMQILARLEQTLSSDDAVLERLAYRKYRDDAALSLQYELVTQSREGNSSARQVLARVQERLLRASGTSRVPEVPEYFVSFDDVEFHKWNLVREPHGYLWWYVDTWRKSIVVIETGEFAQPEIDATQWFPLRHPNVVKLLGAFSTNYPLYFCFFIYELEADARYLNEYLDAVVDDLDRRVATWKCLYDAACGLQYLRSRGVIHGDLCRKNILVSSNATTKLGGLRVPRNSGPAWPPPETVENETALSTKSDIIAFGMCVWEAVVRRTPIFRRGGVPQRSKTMGDAEWDLIAKMCGKDSSDRVDIAYVVSWLKQFVLSSSSKRQQRDEQDESGDASPPGTLAVSVLSRLAGGIFSSMLC